MSRRRIERSRWRPAGPVRFEGSQRDQPDHGLRIQEADHDAARNFPSDDQVAGRQQTDVRLGLQGLMRQRRISGAQDAVGQYVGAEPLLDRALDIDVAQHAEPQALSATVVLAKASSKDSPVSVVANPYMSDLSRRCGREQGATCRTDRCIYPLSRSGG